MATLSGRTIFLINSRVSQCREPLLPNGDILLAVGPTSSIPLTQAIAAGTPTAVREINLATDIVKQVTITGLNSSLAAAGYSNLTLQTFHHDVTPLANGHWLVLANTLKQVTLSGASAPTTVLGDVIIDLDTKLNPVWVWNEFDHLDVNRHPYMFPDWTHTNAVVYSPDDGNLIVSMRHQNWVVKVDYNNGAGQGDILWRLGPGVTSRSRTVPGMRTPIRRTGFTHSITRHFSRQIPAVSSLLV